MKPRAVLDANVIVSGLITPFGNSGRILKVLLEEQGFDLIVSRPILDEIRRCLFYPKVRKHIRLTDQDIERVIVAIESIGDLVSGSMPVTVKIPDRDDKVYLAAAVDGRARYLVSGDSDLLGLGEYDGVSIVTPKVFGELLRK